MTLDHQHLPLEAEALTVRRPYEKPTIQRVDLALAETLSEGCKLGTDVACVGPPTTAFEGGS
jgi:hypothetical protein